MDTKKQLGTQLQLLRKRKQLSQEELAGRIGIDAKSLSRIERGAHYPSIETLEKMAQCLDVEMKDFFDFDGKPSIEGLRSEVIRTAQEGDYELLTSMVEFIRTKRSL